MARYEFQSVNFKACYSCLLNLSLVASKLAGYKPAVTTAPQNQLWPSPSLVSTVLGRCRIEPNQSQFIFNKKYKNQS